MKRDAAVEHLQQALAISRELVQLAESGDVARTVALNGTRRELLHAAHVALQPLGKTERSVVNEIAVLNNRALGLMEHHLRIKVREFDMAAVGRRAVVAYAATA
jgi:hypothetical protein